MKVLLKIIGSLLLLLVLVGAGAFLWASSAADRTLSRTFGSHEIDFPVPSPLSPEELEELVESEDVDGVDLDALARERALERGRHLVESRYACSECHGADFSGGVMVDAAPIGRLLGPNLTTGEGSRTRDYTLADWDRIVRHGILPDGRPALMPSDDFHLMSDQELADIIVYIRSQPPVDNTVPAPSLGPVGRFLVATGRLPLSADRIGAHDRPHDPTPPPTEPTVAFGRHLAGICSGCHGTDFAGGPIPGADPSWAPATNLTPHEDGLAAWSLGDFQRAVREGLRPDGSALVLPMTMIVPYTQRMTDVEVEALWAFFRALPPTPSPAR